jgi:hypothetical protein
MAVSDTRTQHATQRVKDAALRAKDAARRTKDADPRLKWIAAIAGIVLLTIATWPVDSIIASAGFDSSWTIGLNLAVAQHLVFGREIVFNYGPLGFTAYPVAVTTGTLTAALAVSFLVQAALVTTMIVCLRRCASLPLAVVVAVPAAVLIGRIVADPMLVIAFGLTSMALTVPPDSEARWRTILAVGGGLVAAFACLVKLNDGVAAAAIVAIGLAAGASPRRALALGAASFSASLLVMWLALSQPLGALPDYVRNSWEVIHGYGEALGLTVSGWSGRGELLLLGASTVVLSLAAWLLSRPLARRRRIGLVLAVLMPHYFLLREIFTRWSVTRGAYFALLAGIALMLPWGRRTRVLGLACAVILGWVAMVTFERPFDDTFNPFTRAHYFVAQAKTALIASDRRVVFHEGRSEISGAVRVAPKVLAQLRGHCVNVEGDEIALIWRYRLHWCPLPALQSFSAFTPRLDEMDAHAYEDARGGPERVLRNLSAPDTRNPSWESPAAFVALFCNFANVAQKGEWEALARIPNRCGPPRTIAVLHTSLEAAPVQIPPAPPGTALVAQIDGLGVAGLEGLASVVWHAALRIITINGDSFRVAPATADDGLLLWVPPSLDYPQPFSVRWEQPITLRMSIPGHSGGHITIRVLAIPVRGA